MDAVWLLLMVPVLGILGLFTRRRPTVAEVHSWMDAGVYRMLLILNGEAHILRAGLPLGDAEDDVVEDAARKMLRVLGRHVHFTERTVYIPEGPFGLNGDPFG